MKNSRIALTIDRRRRIRESRRSRKEMRRLEIDEFSSCAPQGFSAYAQRIRWTVRKRGYWRSKNAVASTDGAEATRRGPAVRPTCSMSIWKLICTRDVGGDEMAYGRRQPTASTWLAPEAIFRCWRCGKTETVSINLPLSLEMTRVARVFFSPNRYRITLLQV